jgi:cation transporter-like permease
MNLPVFDNLRADFGSAHAARLSTTGRMIHTRRPNGFASRYYNSMAVNLLLQMSSL